MKITLKAIFIVVISALTITGCSRKNDSFVSRNFHAVTAEYNTLFNGNIALEKGRENLNSAYKDNYWDILPVERMQIAEDVILPGQSKNADFVTAEEKAVKAIQKHGMNIEGKEYNPQIDEAYLLLGKSRYFDQRFIPALEAFNYILYKYPASSNINRAKVWREKTNMRLDNDALAIKNLKRLLKQEELQGQDLADATSILAQAYINTKALDSALTQIGIAAKTTKKSNEEGRFYFIQGQLYNALQDKDSANLAFDKVIDLNRKIPRKYLISAYVEKAKNFDYEKGNKLEFIEHLTELEKDRENRPFLDHIYHQIAQYHSNQNRDSLAVVYYNKSIRTNSQDKILIAKNYETLGDMNFDKNNFKVAGAYYDSTMTKMVENSKPFRIIRRKRENLDDVINYEGIAEVNDSILRFVNMPEAERLTYFNDYVARLKAKAEEEKEKAAIALQKQGLAQNIAGQNNSGGFKPAGGPPGASSFYFYNDQTVAYGKNEFTRIWGDRENKDNWRWSSGIGSSQVVSNTLAGNDITEDSELFDVEFYIAQIPTDEKVIDSIAKERNFAYYQLGLIYKEKFKEYELSKTKFTTLLNNNPEARLVLPSKYNLFKIYEILGRTEEMERLKTEIISNYPDTRYAQILSNPELALAKDENSPESVYEATYKLFEQQQFAETISKSEEYIAVFDGEAIVPKFELLKAYAIGRLYGFIEYKKAINTVAANYANTAEGIQAQSILDNALKGIESNAFEDETTALSAKVVFEFTKPTAEELKTLKEAIEKAIDKMKYHNMYVSVDLYNPEKTFVVVHGLRSIETARAFTSLFEKPEQVELSRPFFGISTANYRILQIHKNLESYLTNQ
ncbi:hypothetical protein [Lacinutrix sp. Hel_I_90]|uniref:type IX secretion system periplasmic lipoprotein PorW/SprE n=1 Tax=Lacinutrix sp. Hel_I_90 TaxID=1249999 RepID=UPI0005C930AD|nr:hypothetical protein [Lacinutrix sp. Hel_I_90]